MCIGQTTILLSRCTARRHRWGKSCRICDIIVTEFQKLCWIPHERYIRLEMHHRIRIHTVCIFFCARLLRHARYLHLKWHAWPLYSAQIESKLPLGFQSGVAYGCIHVPNRSRPLFKGPFTYKYQLQHGPLYTVTNA